MVVVGDYEKVKDQVAPFGDVTVLDTDLARLQTLEEFLCGRLTTVIAYPFHVARAVPARRAAR